MADRRPPAPPIQVPPMPPPADPTPAAPEPVPPPPLVGGPPMELVQEPTYPPTMPAPEPVRLRVGNREFELSPDLAGLADAVREREREMGSRLSQMGREREQLMQRIPQQFPQPQPQATPPGPDWNTLWFQDPAAAAQQLIQIASQVAVNRATDLYVTDKTYDTYWRSFYEQHPDLRGAEAAVQAVAQARPDLASRHPNEVRDELADATRHWLLEQTGRLRKSQGGSAPSPPRRTQVEAASGERTAAAPAQTTGPTTLSEQIRALRRKQGPAR